jgi:hypothetical protein
VYRWARLDRGAAQGHAFFSYVALA